MIWLAIPKAAHPFPRQTPPHNHSHYNGTWPRSPSLLHSTDWHPRSGGRLTLSAFFLPWLAVLAWLMIRVALMVGDARKLPLLAIAYPSFRPPTMLGIAITHANYHWDPRWDVNGHLYGYVIYAASAIVSSYTSSSGLFGVVFAFVLFSISEYTFHSMK